MPGRPLGLARRLKFIFEDNVATLMALPKRARDPGPDKAKPVAPGAVVAANDAERESGSRFGHFKETLYVGGVFALIVGSIVVARLGLYTAGSTLGYNLGLAGGVAMLLLFLYPLRKRWRAFASFGRTRVWFALHMVLGIAGPLLIVLHSTLRFGSLNATVAFGCMALVATSGLVGRFLYARIHHGLYGRRASLAEFRTQAGEDAAAVHAKLAFAPAVEARLAAFADRAQAAERGGLKFPWRFFTLGIHAFVERVRCNRELGAELTRLAAAKGWPEEKLVQRIASRRRLAAEYLKLSLRVAQFHVFERLFSWWHVLHVPLVYMLVFSAIAHVVAVHMY